MGSKRSKRSRKEKRISQRAQSSDGSVSEVAMKLEEWSVIDIPTPIETDTVIDGVILVSPLITAVRASCIPVLCRS
ncbi:hypothetical protein PFISCL1PPCAC_26115, partial [Pristionchus fissidentatus]